MHHLTTHPVAKINMHPRRDLLLTVKVAEPRLIPSTTRPPDRLLTTGDRDLWVATGQGTTRPPEGSQPQPRPILVRGSTAVATGQGTTTRPPEGSQPQPRPILARDGMVVATMRHRTTKLPAGERPPVITTPSPVTQSLSYWA
jgi:hypothetical protein